MGLGCKIWGFWSQGVNMAASTILLSISHRYRHRTDAKLPKANI